jgi:hypothetical protein
MWQRVCAHCGWADAGVFWRDAAPAERHLAQSAALICPACAGEAFDLAEVAEQSGEDRRRAGQKRADRGAPPGQPAAD